MKHNQLLYTLLIVAVSILDVTAQSGWLSNFKLAQSAAKTNNKLILVDFWATWCGPCKKMDSEVWSTEEAQKIKQNFIPLKIDIDAEATLASQYYIRSIPNLILMDYKGRIIHNYVGYSSKADLLAFINSIPANATALNEKISLESEKDELSLVQAKEMALAYQDLSKAISYSSLKQSFIQQSERYFKKANKQATNDTELNELELWSSINNIIRGKSKKVVASLQEEKAKYENTPNESLMQYVLLCAYKELGEKDLYESVLALLKSKPDGNQLVKLIEQ